ncbi:MAG: cellulose 1,4-beta-cellobiosidase [Oscillospiraceae bacterium]|nr:cellulose 1,4-beta-cellobiosidase [Oscillospiraceae bacterium]
MVLKKKTQKTVAFALSLSLLAAAAAPMTASAKVNGKAGRTVAEAFGSDTYKNMYLSLYDDVVTKGTANGYLSDEGVPYHAVEEVIVEAPDYGHETTSEAMSYLVWVAAMRDHLTGEKGELAKAWEVLEVMIPEVQTGFMEKTEPSATYSDEWQDPTKYPTDMATGNNGLNPIHKYMCSAYGSDDGLYLLHWLADVDDWYGYGGDSGNFTFINTFQRGEQESCFETVPHGCIEELKYGMDGRGVKGVFTTEDKVAEQWAYTNAPDAEGRAIQAVYWANRWGVGDSSVTAKAGKMADQLRNDMFDKYYKKISKTTTKNDTSAGYDGAHYLMAWYTSWGGAIDGMWTWQIGCSHSHMFYQNVLQAYAVLNDADLKSAMKAEGAVKDWTESLERQLQMYEWLQTPEGPFAGGCTNSWNGRYEDYPSGVATFYDMAFVAHPVYADPGSNGWIGNQVWATQRIAELYYVAKEDGNTAIAERCKTMLDKWCNWFCENVQWNYTDDNGNTMPFAIPATLTWGSNAQPDDWSNPKTNTSGPAANKNLTFTIANYGSSDVGCISSLANTLLYYAAAEGVKPGTSEGSELGILSYNTAKQLIDCMWACYRDDIGISWSEDNGSLTRIFEQEVHVPSSYSGKMPSGDAIEPGIKFIDIRTEYRDIPMFQELEAHYKANKTTAGFELNYHRFWHAGDALMAIGAMASLFPDAAPNNTSDYYQIGQTVTAPKGDIADAGGGGIPPVTTPGGDNTTPGNTPADFTYGDINADGEVDLTDLTYLSLYLMKDRTLTGNALKAADVYGDGDVNLADLAHFKQYICQDPVTLGPQ